MLKCPNGSKLKFDCMLGTKDGYVPGAVIQPIGNDVTKDSNNLKHLNEQLFHNASAHVFEGQLIPTAESMGVQAHGQAGQLCPLWKGKGNEKENCKICKVTQ